MVSAPAVPARPEPRTERGRRVRAGIVDSAATLMYERGVAQTSLDDVLAHSGAGKSQMYHYFANKHDLVRAVIEHQYLAVVDGQPRLSTMSSRRELELWATAFLARHETADGPIACRLGRFAAELDDDPKLRAVLRGAFDRWRGLIGDGLRRMQQRGDLRADADPDELATATLAALQGGILLARLARDAEPLRTAVRLVLDHLGSAAP